MKDLFEFILTALIFGLFNGWDINFVGNVIPTVMTEARSNSFCMYFFTFDFLCPSKDLLNFN